MSSPSFFYLRKFPSTGINGPGFGACLVPSLPSTSQRVQSVRHFTSPSKYCGPPIKLPLPYYHRLLCLRSRTTNFRQTRSLAGSSNKYTGLCPRKKLYYASPKAIEAIMLCKWHKWSSYPNLRRKQINQYFDLWYVFRMLDGILFQGMLRNCVLLKWRTPKGKLDCRSRTKVITDARRGPCVRIEVTKPLVNGPWTLAIMQERLNVLLYEMTQVFFLMNSRTCVPSQRSNKRCNRASNGRQFGYGSLFKKSLQEVDQKANRILKGPPGQWDLRR